MRLDDVQAMIVRDSILDISKLDRDSLNVPYLQGSYINLYSSENGKLKTLELDLRELRFQKFIYYDGQGTGADYQENPLNHKPLKTHIQKYIDADADVIAFERRLLVQRIKVDAISDFVKSLTQRTFLIKSAIDFLKFTNGA